VLSVGDAERCSLLARPRRKWKYNIEMNRKQLGCLFGLDSSGLHYGPVADSCKHGNELQFYTNFWECLSNYYLF
jgi:hypothetical protein